MRYTGLLQATTDLDYEIQNIWSPEEMDYYFKNTNPDVKNDLIKVSDDGLKAYKNVNNYSVMYVDGEATKGPLIAVPEPHPLFNCHYIYSEDDFCFERMDLTTRQYELLNDCAEVIISHTSSLIDSIVEGVDVTNRYIEEQ